MSASAYAPTALPSFNSPAARLQRAQAFAAARSHSRLVRRLRTGIVVIAVVSVAGLALSSIFDPFRVLAPGVTVNSAGLNGTKVTMEQPKMSGFRRDGRAYSVNAASSVQDIRNPTIIELNGVSAHVAMADKSNAEIKSPTGIYDTKKEQMTFSGNVQVKNDAGYDLEMKSATMDFKGSILSTDEPMSLVMKTGTVTADAMRIFNNGQQITFEGNVLTTMKADTAQTLKEADK